jgi:hypothetical protein
VVFVVQLPPLPKGVKRKFEAQTHEVPDIKSVTIEDVGDDENGDRPEFAPNGDADYFAEEDEDGRFL